MGSSVPAFRGVASRSMGSSVLAPVGVASGGEEDRVWLGLRLVAGEKYNRPVDGSLLLVLPWEDPQITLPKFCLLVRSPFMISGSGSTQ